MRAGSPQERVLQKLKGTVAPTIDWVATAPVSADPLDDVESGQANYAIVDAREYSFARHLYPNVAVGFTLPADAAGAVDRAEERAGPSEVGQ